MILDDMASKLFLLAAACALLVSLTNYSISQLLKAGVIAISQQQIAWKGPGHGQSASLTLVQSEPSLSAVGIHHHPGARR